jgi:hypothetical protein
VHARLSVLSSLLALTNLQATRERLRREEAELGLSSAEAEAPLRTRNAALRNAASAPSAGLDAMHGGARLLAGRSVPPGAGSALEVFCDSDAAADPKPNHGRWSVLGTQRELHKENTQARLAAGAPLAFVLTPCTSLACICLECSPTCASAGFFRHRPVVAGGFRRRDSRAAPPSATRAVRCCAAGVPGELSDLS